jgi:hypothetical protein
LRRMSTVQGSAERHGGVYERTTRVYED